MLILHIRYTWMKIDLELNEEKKTTKTTKTIEKANKGKKRYKFNINIQFLSIIDYTF